MEHISFTCVDWQNNRTKLNRANMVAGINNPLEELKDTTNDLIDSLATVATTGSYNDLTNKPDLAAVATSGSYNDLTGTPNLAAVATSGLYSDLTGTPNLATVATSGSYNDLTNKPNLDLKLNKSNFQWSLADHAYDDQSTYNVGDTVYFENADGSILLYECKEAITTAEPFTSDHWTKVTMERLFWIGESIGIKYLSQLPQSNNQTGLKVVVCNSEPQNKYDGYIYLIKEN